MRAITKRLVGRYAETAQRNAVSRLVSDAVCTPHLNTAHCPQRPADTFGSFPHQADKRLKMRLERVTSGLRLRTLVGTPEAAGAVPRLLLDRVGSSRLVALEHQVPHVAFGIAKSRKCT